MDQTNFLGYASWLKIKLLIRNGFSIWKRNGIWWRFPSFSLPLMTAINLNNNLTSFCFCNLVISGKEKKDQNQKKEK
jgi:hypothetical protein